MPLYEYQCETCQHRLEVLQGISEPRLAVCPECGGELKKQFSAPSFQFKGSGWYVTDYARKGNGDKADKADKAEKAEKAAGKESGGESGSSPKKGDAKSGDSSTAGKSTPKSAAAKAASSADG